MPPTRDEVLAAAQAALVGRDAVTDGYNGTSVAVVAGDLVVAFRWRAHPREFQVRLPLTDLHHGPWTGIRADTATEWVNEVTGLLMEELDTGATHWAVRYERDGRIELDLDAGPPTRSGYYVSEVGPTRALWLNEHGLSVPEAMAAKASGVLRVWLQMYVNNARGEPVVAHLVITGTPRPDTAELTALQVLQDVPLPDLTRLAHHGLCLAAEAGAQQITSSLHHPALTEAGMHSNNGRLTLDALAPWPVPAAFRQT